MSKKQLVPGFKNSQKIRVIIANVGINMTVGELDTLFSPAILKQVAIDCPPHGHGRTCVLVHLLQQY
jgi:hypothetical protein